jgi:hypothetical protein
MYDVKLVGHSRVVLWRRVGEGRKGKERKGK